MAQYVYGQNPYSDILQRVYNINDTIVQTHLPSAFSDLSVRASRQYPRNFDQLPLLTQIPSTGQMNRVDYGNALVDEIFNVDIIAFVDSWYANASPDDAQYNAEAVIHAVKQAYYARPQLELVVEGEDYVLPYLLERCTLTTRTPFANGNDMLTLRWTLQVPFTESIVIELKDN